MNKKIARNALNSHEMREAADVANLTMMIADIAEKYAKEQREDNHEARYQER